MNESQEFIHLVTPSDRSAARREQPLPDGKDSNYELRPLLIKPEHLRTRAFVPAVIRPIVDAANEGDDINPIVKRVLELWGFTTFMYAIGLAPQPGFGGRKYVYTTQNPDWVRRYEANDYVERDPRVQIILENALPVVWDQDTFRGRSPEVNAFLDDALAHGIGSGVCMGMRDLRAPKNVIAFNSPEPKNTAFRLRTLDRCLDEMTMFCFYFHEIFITNVLATSETPSAEGRNLSPREIECLQHVVSGLRDKVLAERMDITPRTVQLHMDSIRAKLGALTREQAVAKAIRLGLVAA